MSDEAHDAGDEKKVRRKRLTAKVQRESELGVLRQMLSTKGGRDFFWRVLERCQVYSTSFRADPHVTAFNEGRRDVGLWALTEIFEADPDAYTLMRKEAQERDKRNV